MQLREYIHKELPIKIVICQAVLWSLLIACNNQNNRIPLSQQRNDTATLVQLAIKTALYHGNLPGIESLAESDFIIITGDSSYFKFIPSKIDTVRFKTVNRNEACPLLNKEFSNQSNYLYLRAVEKTDSNYYISIQNLSCEPYRGGGAIGIYLFKRNDSFIVKNHISSSIN